MNTTDAIRTVVAKAGLTNVQVSEACGRSQSWYSVKLKRPLVSSSVTSEIARACGYTLCLIPSSKVPKSAIVIDPAE